MSIDTELRLSDIGLFKKPRKHEEFSQYQRACQIRDRFAKCMNDALVSHACDLPDKCARGDDFLACAHLVVDYTNFTQRVNEHGERIGGIPLTGLARKKIDARLRAIGTLVYRIESGYDGPIGSLPGDIYIPELDKISTFTGTRKATGARKAKSRSRAAASKESGLLGRLLGGLFE